MMIFINPVLDFRRIQSDKQEGAAIWKRNIRNCDKWYDKPWQYIDKFAIWQ